MSLGKRTEPVDEFTLTEGRRGRELETFGKLVDAYQSRVFGFVRRMIGDADEASDLTQEVFIRAYQHFDRFDGRSSVKTWLFRIAHNLCVDRLRKASRSPVEVGMALSADGEDEFEAPDDRWEPERLALQEELAEVVEKAVAGMSEKLRSVLLLHDREDASYEEIAQTLNLPVGTVKSRLFLARAHLQSCLKPYLQGESTS